MTEKKFDLKGLSIGQAAWIVNASERVNMIVMKEHEKMFNEVLSLQEKLAPIKKELIEIQQAETKKAVEEKKAEYYKGKEEAAK